MTRTMWIALFCLVTLGALLAIRVAAPPASLSVEALPGQSKIGMESGPNESAKSDRLELPDVGAKIETMPAPQAVPADTPSATPETIKIPSRRWQDAHAKIAPSEPPHRRTIAREQKKSAGSEPPKTRAEVWHCRQDAMGNLLRSLDLSPRCNM
jgi:hypothetical protein